MKNLLCVLMTGIFATASMAAVTLTESNKSGTRVTVGYNYDGTGARPRAFALVLQATGGTITSVTPAKTGQSTATARGMEYFRERSQLGYGNVTSYELG